MLVLCGFSDVVIGFTEDSFTVTEGEDFQYLTVGLTSGQLGREVEVVLDLRSGSAVGIFILIVSDLISLLC